MVLRRSALRIGSLMGIALCVGTVIAFASPSAASPRPRSFSLTIGYVAGRPTTDFAGSVAALTAREPATRGNVKAVLDGMLARLRDGKRVGVPGTRTAAAARFQIRAALAELRAPRSHVANEPAAHAAGAGGYPVVGEATHGGLIWSFVNPLGEPAFALQGQDCNSESGCTETVYILGTGTISPGAVTSKIDVKITTYLNLGGYKDIHFDAGVFCYRNQEPCGGKGSKNLVPVGTKSATIFLSSEHELFGDRISFALELWGLSPQGWRNTGGATEVGRCELGPETACRW